MSEVTLYRVGTELDPSGPFLGPLGPLEVGVGADERRVELELVDAGACFLPTNLVSDTIEWFL